MKRPVYFRVYPDEEYQRIRDTESEPFEGEKCPEHGSRFTIKQLWKEGALYVDVELIKLEEQK